MNYTENEILTLKKHIVSSGIPINFDLESKGTIVLKYKNDFDVKAKLTKIFQYECSAYLPNGQYYSFQHTEFNQFIYYFRQWISKIKSEYPNMVKKSEYIESFSLKFYTVFQEAILINCLKFDESAGMIYRKSLEILIKDFLKLFLPDFQDIIMNETVGGIIFFFYDDNSNKLEPRLNRKFKKNNYEFNSIKDKLNEILPFINFVNHTFKLGNDFSHYERRLEKYNTQDLENNIMQITEYLDTKFQVEIHSEKINTLNNKFNSYQIE